MSGQRRMARLLRDDRKARVPQIKTCYNQEIQKSISECTRCLNLKQTGGSRRPD